VHLYPGAAVIGIMLEVGLLTVSLCWPDFVIIAFLFHYTAGLRVLVLFSRGRVGLTYGTGLAFLLKFFESFGFFLAAAILSLALTIPGLMLLVIPLELEYFTDLVASGAIAIWAALAVIIYSFLLRKEWLPPRKRSDPACEG
jgi:hypothetical protein